MIEILRPLPEEVEGAVFDVDDTLVDNKQTVPAMNLHAQSRLRAVREAGELHDLSYLRTLSVEANYWAFLNAREHTLEAAIWNILCDAGVVEGVEVDYQHPLVCEIFTRKNELHETLLREQAEPVPGVLEFVPDLYHELPDKLSIATGAIRSEVDIFLGKWGLSAYFGNKIVSKEQIRFPKPHHQAFDLGFASLGLPEGSRGSVLAFEDDPKGIASAKAAGLYVVALTTRYSAEQLLNTASTPDLIAANYYELYGHVLNMAAN